MLPDWFLDLPYASELRVEGDIVMVDCFRDTRRYGKWLLVRLSPQTAAWLHEKLRQADSTSDTGDNRLCDYEI